MTQKDRPRDTVNRPAAFLVGALSERPRFLEYAKRTVPMTHYSLNISVCNSRTAVS